MAKYTYIPNRVIDSDGIADGAAIYFYLPGTTTPVQLYSDPEYTVPVSNPYVVFSGAAVPPLYWQEDIAEVRVRVVSADGEVISDDDPWALGFTTSADSVTFVQDGGESTTVGNELRGRVTVTQFGADPTGVEDSSEAFTKAREASNGHYIIPPGTYKLSSDPNVWEDTFVAPYGVTVLDIEGIQYDVSGAFSGGFQWNMGDSQRYTYMLNSRTGEPIVRWSDGELSSDSHRVYLPWDIRRDSHVFIAAPGTNGGTTDWLWRRSDAHPDPRGNRFAFNFNEGTDQYLLTYATNNTGSPGFDAAYIIKAGSSPTFEFHGIRADFLQGWGIRSRSGAPDRLDIRYTPGASTHTLSEANTGQILQTTTRSAQRLSGVSFNTLRDAPTSREGAQRFSVVLSDSAGDQTAPLSKVIWNNGSRPNNRIGGILKVVDASRGVLIIPFSSSGTTVTMGTALIDTLTAGGVVTVGLSYVGENLTLSVSTLDASYTTTVDIDYAGAGR